MTAIEQDALPRRPDHFWNPGTPVHFDEQLDTWHAFSHADVLRVLTDDKAFSAGYGLTDETRPYAFPALSGMWGADGRRHDDLRAAVVDPFRRSVLESLSGDIRRIVTTLLDEVVASGAGEVEAVRMLARPLPSQVICRVLGLDLDYAERVHAWMDEVYRVASSTNTFPAQSDQVRCFEDLMAERRKAPQDGLVDELLAAQAAGYQVDGRPMSDWDLVGYFAMLLSAGVDTTSGGIGNALLFLTEYGHWEELRIDPSLIPNAIEETLRWYPAFPGVRRLVVADTELGGQKLTAGQWATGWLTSANRDPELFPNPDTFDIRRRPNRHLTLGFGVHHCLGASLARLELRILIEEAVRRLPKLRRIPDAPISRRAWVLENLNEAHFTFDVTTAAH
jgi:cytochrome P450